MSDEQTEQRVDAIRLVLGGLAEGVDVGELASRVVLLHPRDHLFPGDVFIEMAADALDLAGIARARPLDYAEIRQRYLPEVHFSGNTAHQKSHTALRAAAMIHGGVIPDLDEDAGWWKADDFWLFALYTLTIYLRVAAERTGEPVATIARQLAERHHVTL